MMTMLSALRSSADTTSMDRDRGKAILLLKTKGLSSGVSARGQNIAHVRVPDLPLKHALDGPDPEYQTAHLV